MNEKSMAGWIGFAGLLMLIIGSIDVFQGFIALIEDEYFVVTSSGFLAVDLTAWGWVLLIWGVLMIVAGHRTDRGAVVGAVVHDRPRVVELLRPARLSRQQPVSALGADRLDAERRRALRADGPLAREQGRPGARAADEVSLARNLVAVGAGLSMPVLSQPREVLT